MVFERLFQSPEVTDLQQEHGWQRASEDILSVVAKTTALNSVMSLLLSSCVLTQKRHHSPSHKPPSSPMGPTRCLGKEDPTVNTSTWHFLSASQGHRRCDPVCTDPSQNSRASGRSEHTIPSCDTFLVLEYQVHRQKGSHCHLHSHVPPAGP